MSEAEKIIKDMPFVKYGLDNFYGHQTVLNALNQALNLHIVSKSYHFEWEGENNEAKHFYISATKEQDAFNEFYSHFPNAKYVMVSKS